MKNSIILVLILSYIALNSMGQNVIRNTISSFSIQASNDSIIFTGGQSMSGFSFNPSTQHGYLPLSYSTLGFEELEAKSLRIYPNPTKHEFWISVSEEQSFDIEIHNIFGELVLVQLQNNGLVSVNIEDLPAGTYIINVQNQDGSAEFSKIIIL